MEQEIKDDSLWTLPWGFFKRWCHLMWHIIKFDFHVGATYNMPWLIFPMTIECFTCGKCFWSRRGAVD